VDDIRNAPVIKKKYIKETKGPDMFVKKGA